MIAQTPLQRLIWKIKLKTFNRFSYLNSKVHNRNPCFLQGAITKRMTAIEEMAGMDVLCSDKTGTLTLNKLTVDKNMVEVLLVFPSTHFKSNGAT